jgi:hypothetical protein
MAGLHGSAIAWQSKGRPAAPTDVERIEAVLRWLRDELHDMKDRDAWRSPPEPAVWLRRLARPHVHAVIREKFEGVRFRRL